MMDRAFDVLPLWAIYILTALALHAATEAGYRVSKGLQRKPPTKSDAGVGAAAAATLALLGFLLAFVVGFAGNLFNERRQLVVDEANAIGTTYLRAGFLDEPYRTEAREALREYVDMRLAALDRTQLETAIARSEAIQLELWRSAETVARESPTPITALYVSSLNEVIDLHAERVSVSLAIRIPRAVLLGLYTVALFTMFLVGMQGGYAESRNLLAQVLLVLVLSVVFVLILDLDRSRQGLLQVPQQALIDLQRQLQR